MREVANNMLRPGAIARFVAGLLVCGTPFLAAQDMVIHAQRGGDHFARKSTREQKRIVNAVRAATLEVGSEHFSAIHAVVATGPKRGAGRGDRSAKKTRKRKSKKRAPKSSGADRWELPFTVSYSFGRKAVEPLAGKSSARARAERRIPVELALMGLLPDTDRALAELEARLDSDRSADAFAAFLDSWQNGGETFYEALDRTAGTSDSVFFYDAMLGDFVEEIADPDHPSTKKLRMSHDAAHDALHRAFLTYRQYRAFREAVALSLLLPPDVPLPKRLSRYEAKVAGMYSLREQVLMVLAVNDHDPMAVADLVRAAAKPLPVPLWSERFDPFVSWQEIFAAAMPRMIETSGHTDAFLKAVLAERSEQAAEIRAVACRVVGVASAAAGY